jgi:lipopolysaccharide export system protein LptA
MMKKAIKININLQNYYRNFFIFIVLFGTIAVSLTLLSIFKIAETFKYLKKLQTLIESNFSKIEESFEFKDGNFAITISDKLFNYVVRASLQENISTQLPLSGEKPYETKFLEGLIYKLPLKADLEKYQEEWIETYKISSNIFSINAGVIEISGNISGIYNTKQNPKFNNTKLLASKINFSVENKIATGENVVIKNASEGKFAANTFKILANENIGEFAGNVMFENKDYKITSEMLDAKMQENEIESLFFRQKVIFYDKNAKGMVVKGDNAIFKKEENELMVYGNVVIVREENSLEIRAENFIYNENTKKGSFKALNDSKVRVSLDI